MKRFESMPYTNQIRWRIRLSWLVLAGMLVYMVVVAELGGGDSRRMTDLANFVSDLIFFGGFVYIASRIHHNKKLLQNRAQLKEQRLAELDERRQYLHDKSGGIVLDVLLIVLLFVTTTAALFNTAAFYTAFTILSAALLAKAAAYWAYSH